MERRILCFGRRVFSTWVQYYWVTSVVPPSPCAGPHHWRDKAHHEVDFVLTQRGAKPIAVECKRSERASMFPAWPQLGAGILTEQLAGDSRRRRFLDDDTSRARG